MARFLSAILYLLVLLECMSVCSGQKGVHGESNAKKSHLEDSEETISTELKDELLSRNNSTILEVVHVHIPCSLHFRC